MAATTELTAYYAQRAREYERIYAKPERQDDLASLRARIPALLADRTVYEVACGTGYWTPFIADRARSVFATDYNEEVLAVAREKPAPADRVIFAQADAFALPDSPVPCDAAFAGFWWSHLRHDELDGFLQGYFARLLPGSRFVFVDNAYVEGSSIPIRHTDAAGNTYQQRKLENGGVHDVLKNFPDEAALRARLAPHARVVHYERLPYYWLVWGELK